MELLVLPALKDNYVYMVCDPSDGIAAVVDPAEAGPAINAAESRGRQIGAVFNTHHHDDHIFGDQQIKTRYRCPVIGARADAHRIPEMDIGLGDGDHYQFGTENIQVIATPGHTSGHISFYFPRAGLLFCGDTLFSLGCGRLFEGTAAQMWASLLRLRALPDTTKVCCAHEYTLSNARFALSIEPGNPALVARAAAATAQRERNAPTVPTTMAEEKATNPFLRADRPEIAAALGMSGAPPVEVFAELRRRKDRF
ncbi:MAG: hydroxyacylglutathione hydrolase [Rhodospirillaceae bacterium]